MTNYFLETTGQDLVAAVQHSGVMMDRLDLSVRVLVIVGLLVFGALVFLSFKAGRKS